MKLKNAESCKGYRLHMQVEVMQQPSSKPDPLLQVSSITDGQRLKYLCITMHATYILQHFMNRTSLPRQAIDIMLKFEQMRRKKMVTG